PPADASVSAVLAPDADTRLPDIAHGATHSARSLFHPATPPVPGSPGTAPAAPTLHRPLPRLQAPSATQPPHWPPQTRPRRHCPLRAPAVLQRSTVRAAPQSAPASPAARPVPGRPAPLAWLGVPPLPAPDSRSPAP